MLGSTTKLANDIVMQLPNADRIFNVLGDQLCMLKPSSSLSAYFLVGLLLHNSCCGNFVGTVLQHLGPCIGSSHDGHDVHSGYPRSEKTVTAVQLS